MGHLRVRNIPEIYWEDSCLVRYEQDPRDPSKYNLIWPPRLSKVLGESLSRLKPPDGSPLAEWQNELEEGMFY